jgi:hypothetical protein
VLDGSLNRLQGYGIQCTGSNPCANGGADWLSGNGDGSNQAEAEWAKQGGASQCCKGYNDTPPQIPGHPGNDPPRMGIGIYG